ncbi:MAG: aminoacyl-tRNA hydrolase [Coriobacteriales bacterium]|nr:aminoacyl-tRNA hydrolase [Coriobacteriales bacterium]
MAEQKPIRVICGLGNPGEKYALTRHNAGFVTVDALAERYGARYWKNQAGCLAATVRIGEREVVLAKPQGFMNTSGGPLSKLARELRVRPEEILVVHDEVDLPAGEIRYKFGGGLNAHNGLRSIKAKLGTADFARIRVGIGRPPGKMSVADWALRQLKGTFAEEFLVTCAQAADVVEEHLT